MKMPRFSVSPGSTTLAAPMLAVALCAGLSACGGGGSDLCRISPVADEATATQQLQAERQRKDAYFRDDPKSPVPAELRSSFGGLQFYPPNWNLRLEGPLIRRTNGRHFQMATSKQKPRPCQEVGYFLVDLGAGQEKLPVYRFLNEEDAGEDLFLPFTDATTDEGETYPAGRYLEIEALSGGRYLLDFNQAYNPYCAYGGSWDCPIAPPENHLKAAVRAGEKGWVHHEPAPEASAPPDSN